MKKLFTLAIMAFMSIVTLAQSTTPTDLSIVGDAVGGWGLYDHVMRNKGDGTFEYVGDFSAGSMKIAANFDWLPCYCPAESGTALSTGSITYSQRTSYDDPDNTWTMTAGRYSIVVNTNNGTLTVSEAASTTPDVKGMYIAAIGDATDAGWSIDNAVRLSQSSTDNNTFSADMNLAAGEVKFLCQKDWGNHYGPVTNGEEISGAGTYDMTYHTADDYKFKITATEKKEYTVTLNISTNKMTISAKEATSINNNTIAPNAEKNTVKCLDNGRIVIMHNGSIYNITGQQIK